MLSVPLNVKVVGPSATGSIVVSGSTLSSPTVHVQLAGVESAFPAASVAYTLNVCSPTEISVYSAGEVQMYSGWLSSLHRKTAPSGSVEANVNVAVVAVVSA